MPAKSTLRIGCTVVAGGLCLRQRCYHSWLQRVGLPCFLCPSSCPFLEFSLTSITVLFWVCVLLHATSLGLIASSYSMPPLKSTGWVEKRCESVQCHRTELLSYSRSNVPRFSQLVARHRNCLHLNKEQSGDSAIHSERTLTCLPTQH